MFIVLYRESDSDDSWIEAGRYKAEDREAALKKYAMRLKEYGTQNVIFAEILRMTCIVVEVLFDGETVNSQ